MIWPLVPVTFLSILAAWWLLDIFDDLTARRVIGAIILLMFFLQVFRELKKEFLLHLPDSKVFRWISCALIGVSTMLANAAGPVYSIYALVHKMPKMEFLGVGARFFLLVNLFKIPLLGQLDLINPESLHLNALLLPALIAGILLGRKLIHLIPQRAFEILLYAFSAISLHWGPSCCFPQNPYAALFHCTQKPSKNQKPHSFSFVSISCHPKQF